MAASTENRLNSLSRKLHGIARFGRGYALALFGAACLALWTGPAAAQTSTGPVVQISNTAAVDGEAPVAEATILEEGDASALAAQAAGRDVSQAASQIASVASGQEREEPTGPLEQFFELPATKLDRKFEKFMTDLDLEDDQRFLFHFKKGGTSIGFKISKPLKRRTAVFLPESSATKIEGEVVAYRLSRLLRVSRLFNPASYYVLGPRAIIRFQKLLRVSERNKWRRRNTANVRTRIGERPDHMLGIVKYRNKRRSQGVKQLTNGGGSFNTNHILANFMKADGVRPPKRKLRLRRVGPDKKRFIYPSERANELTRQLSIIFVMDMLTGQWDRFTGGNVEVYALKEGRLQFVARDNGGAGLERSMHWYDKYIKWVTRFDRPFIDRLTQLNEFLEGRGEAFGGFADVDQFKKVVGFRTRSGFKSFSKKLKRFVEQDLPNLESRFGDKIYFVRDGSQLVLGDEAPAGNHQVTASAAVGQAGMVSLADQIRALRAADNAKFWYDVPKRKKKVRVVRARTRHVRKSRRVRSRSTRSRPTRSRRYKKRRSRRRYRRRRR